MEKTARLFLPSLAILALSSLLPAFATAQAVVFSHSNGISNCPTGTVCSTNWSGFAVTATSVTDGSQHFSTTGTVSGAARSSAEWIVERPALCNGHHCKLTSLSNFGTVSLGNDYTGIASTNYATINGATGGIGSFGSANIHRITMVNNSGATLAEPSVLST